MKSFGLFLLFVFMTFAVSACGASAPSTPSQAPAATEGPTTGDLPTATALSQSLSKEEQLAALRATG